MSKKKKKKKPQQPEPNIITCPICRAPMTEELLTYKVDRNNQEIMLEEVPTWVCERCDTTHVEDDVIEAVEELLEQLDEEST